MSESPLPDLERLLAAPRPVKITRGWQSAVWRHWPASADWPSTLSLCEAAAYRRMHPATLRKLCAEGKVRHQRIGAAYRLAKDDLDRCGLVEARPAQVAEPVLGGAA